MPWQSLERKGQYCKRVNLKMARRKRVTVQPREQQVPLWLQVAVSLWMLGVLLWFFADHKIQQWLAMMLADLLGR